MVRVFHVPNHVAHDWPTALIDGPTSTRLNASPDTFLPLHASRPPIFQCWPQRFSIFTLDNSVKITTMLRQDYNRVDPKRRNVVDHRKKQFATPQYKDAEYPHRLNFYTDAPTADITLEQFEQWAIDRLRGMPCLRI